MVFRLVVWCGSYCGGDEGVSDGVQVSGVVW